MKVKGFGAWPSSNISSGGHKNSYDGFNRSFKGDEFNTEYKKKHYPDSMGYMSRGIKEYNRYPETKDLTADDDNKSEAASSAALGAMLLKKGGRSRQRLFQQVIVLAVGSVMIATSYQAALASRQNDAVQDEPQTTMSTGQDPDGKSPEEAIAATDGDNTQPDSVPETTEAATDSDASDESGDYSSNANENNAFVPGGNSGSSAEPNENSTANYGSDSSSDSSSNSNSNSSSDNNSDNSSDKDSDSKSENKSKTSSDDDDAASVSWKWSSDKKKAAMIIKNSSGKQIDKITADVTTSSKAATCNKDGKKTYTAEVKYDGKSYSDSKSEKISALGHDFDSGKEITLGDGSSAMEFICKRCNEHFTIKNSLDEE